MNSTHVLVRPVCFEPLRFAHWAIDVHRMLHDFCHLVKVAGINGYGEPFISHNAVAFNGVSGESYEPFLMEQQFDVYSGFRISEQGTVKVYCKTGRKPYDLFVTASLTRLKWYFDDDVTIYSGATRSEWKPGVDLCYSLFGIGGIDPVTRGGLNASA